MYSFPKRVKQHKIESKALAIFLYNMRNFDGIIRDLRQSDYGIDLEYEFVSGESVVGRFLKIQMKGSEDINPNKPIIKKLKQSTLNYWAEISYRVNTIVVEVDVVTERIYFTFPIFWDAIARIDDTEEDKSIPFTNMTYNPKKDKMAHLNEASAILIHHMALIPPINELLLTQKNVLTRIDEIIEFCSTCLYSDQFLEFEEFDELKKLLDDAKVLLWNYHIQKEFEDLDKNVNKKHDWDSLDFFRENTNDGTLKYWDMRDKLNIIIVPLLKELVSLRKKALNGFIYWLVKDRDYLELVYKNNVSKFLGENIDEILKKYASCDKSYIERDYDTYVMNRIDKLERKRKKRKKK